MNTGKIDIDKLSETKRKLLSRLLQTIPGEQGIQIIPGQEKKEYYPLSYNQEQLWFLDTIEKGNPFYNVPFATRFNKELDIKILQAALREVIRRHQILKTSYITIAGKPYQKIEPGFTPEIFSRDLQEENDPERQAQEMLTEEAKIPFNPGVPPIKVLLLGLSAKDYILMIKFHHILIDGWSIPIFSREFLQVYQSIEQNKGSPLPALSTRYVDFALWQRRKVREGGFENQLQYWRGQLSGAIEPLDLPTEFPRPTEQSFRGKRQLSVIPADLLQQLKTLTKDTGCTLFMAIVAGFSILLSRYTGKKDILMGTQMANRVMPGLEPLIGYFSNTVVLRFQVTQHVEFKEYLLYVKKVTRETQENQEFPFEKLVQELRVPRTLGQNPLFQVMLVYQVQTSSSDDFQQYKTAEIRPENDTAKFDLDIAMSETPDKIGISTIYNTDIFARPRIERMLSHFENILRSVSREPGQRISNIDFLTGGEKKKILYAWNDTGTLFPKDSCLHTLFEHQAVEDPGAFCIYFRDRQVTRDQLEKKSNQLARYLKKQGAGPNRLVAICMEKSIEMVIGLIAILKASSGYLPIDPTYPPGRVQYMLTHSGAELILTQRHLRDSLPGTGSRVTCLDSQSEVISRESTEPSALVNTPGDVVYGIFTSGSTGNPKMTALDHRGRVNNFTDFNRRFEIGKQDRVLAVSSLGFDMCAYDILGSLACGSAIVLPEPDFELQPAHWAELMVRHDVTLWHSVPSKLELLTNYIAANPAYIPGKCRLVLLGGDWIPLHLPERFWELVPGAVMVSLGGATEVSMDSTIYIIENVESTWKSIPYGKPMANQLTYIIDDNFNLVPEGIPGELCIGGVGVGWGYNGNPGLTAEKFIPNPWSQTPGDRMYRTGDLARYNSDGVLELLGRIDHQVKIRGYRIELGEIETVLSHHELIDKALVMAKKDMGKDKTAPRITAYVIPVKGAAQDLTPGNLRLYIKDRLPEYFIPSGFIFLERFPLTPNGKIDRRALQELKAGEESREKEAAGPRIQPASKIEKFLAAAWKNLLEVDDISIDDNFFSLGGDSIKCIQLVTRVREAGLDITLKQIFRHQTIGELAKVIENAESITIKDSIPVTAHQYLLISGMNAYDHPLIDNLWLELPGHVTPGMCKEALSMVTREYDCFKLRFRAGEAGWWQSYDGQRSNLMYFTHVEIQEPADADIYDYKTVTRARENLEKVIDLLDGPLLGAVLFTMPRESSVNGNHENSKKFFGGGLKNEGLKGRRVEGEKVRSSETGLKDSKPFVSANSHELSSNRHPDAFAADTVQLKKPSGGPEGLIGPPCHGAPGRRRQRNKLLLAVPRLIISGISQCFLVRDLERIIYGAQQEDSPASLARGSFIKWADTNKQKLFNGPVPVAPNPPAVTGKLPDWRDVSFSLELSRVPGIAKVLQAQPLISLPEILLSAICSALAQENKTGDIIIDLLLSGRKKAGKTFPPGCHGDFFPLRAGAGEFISLAETVKWVHRFMTINRTGNKVGDVPGPANDPSAVSVHMENQEFPPLSDEINQKFLQGGPGGAVFSKSAPPGRRRQSPIGTNGLQLILWSEGDRLVIDVIYDGNIRSAAAVERFYSCFREELSRAAGIYSTGKHVIYTEADFLGTGITQAELSHLFCHYPGLIDIYAPGPMQRSMLRNWRRFTGTGLYVIQSAFYIPVGLDIAAMEKSWRQLIRRYDILRTVFCWKGLKQPVQVVLESMEFSIQKEDWREKDADRRKEDLLEFIEKQRAAGFELEKGPLIRFFLIRLSETRHIFIQFNSYLILDGWSVFLLRKELLSLYKANTGQSSLKRGENQADIYRYRDYIDWVNGQDLAAARDFWKGALQGINAPTLLHQAKQNRDRLSREKDPDRGFESQTTVLDKEITQVLQRISRRNKLTFHAMVMGAWYLVVRDWLERSDLVFGIISSGRPASLPKVESIIGLFINTIPLRVHWDDEGSFIEQGHKIGEFLNSAAAYEYINRDEIEQSLNFPDRSFSLFDTVLVFDNYPSDKSMTGTAHLEDAAETVLPWEYLNLAQVELPLRIDIWTGDIEQTSFIFSYYRDKFSPWTIGKLSKGLKEKLVLIAESPDKSIKNYLKKVPGK